ncbi:hypothetical protein L226DRAFT_569338 [Lentinus tigrinus ALCF2SS1-7]|uniref:uncharacterized protein n=1 Tax=Lentinus tigrinus ALCF2SS1-7 TaxID=1328758 RepID=UPI0011661A52|nr:hypothetical protein L226DRAFT_569338 [Lentinus tigrinus ALCF2SS1-7]
MAKDDLDQWVKDIGPEESLQYVPMEFGPKQLKRKRTGASKPVKAASSGKKSGPSKGKGGKGGKEKAQSKGTAAKAKASESKGGEKGVKARDGRGAPHPQRKVDPKIDALFPPSSDNDEEEEEEIALLKHARLSRRDEPIKLSDDDGMDIKPIQLDDDDDDDDDVKPAPHKCHRKSEPSIEGQSFSAYIMLEPDEVHAIPKTSLSRFRGKGAAPAPPKPKLRGLFEFDGDVSYHEFLERFANACHTLTHRLEPEEMTWQFERPANSHIRPLTNKSGYQSMLKQLQSGKVKVINIRHPSVKENSPPSKTYHDHNEVQSEDEYGDMRRHPSKYSVQSQLLAAERSLHDPMKMLEEKYPEGNYADVFPGKKKRWYAGEDGLFWELTRVQMQAWAVALSAKAPGVDINTPPFSMHFATKHGIKPPKTPHTSNTASTSSSVAPNAGVSTSVPGSSITLDAMSLFASLFSSAPAHLLVPAPNQIPSLGISPALAQQLSMLSSLSQPLQQPQSALVQPFFSYPPSSSVAQQLPAFAQPAYNEQYLALAQQVPPLVASSATSASMSCDVSMLPGLGALPAVLSSTSSSALHINTTPSGSDVTHAQGEGEFGFTKDGWQCFSGSL